jgi:cyclophilin family peptidyl-prolyl cis-trans isomerase
VLETGFSLNPRSLSILIAILAALVAACSSGDESALPSQLRPTSAAPGQGAAAAQPSATAPASISSPATATCGSGGEGIGAIQRTGQRAFAAPPRRVIDPTRTYVASVQTDRGGFTLLLAAQDVPNTTNNFVFLACSGYYDGLTFHRVEQALIQGGDPNGNGTGGPGYTIDLELNQKWQHGIGALGMARTAQPNTAGSQFYITLFPQPGLDGAYTVFGRVLTGMEVVRAIKINDKIVRVDIEQH